MSSFCWIHIKNQHKVFYTLKAQFFFWITKHKNKLSKQTIKKFSFTILQAVCECCDLWTTQTQNTDWCAKLMCYILRCGRDWNSYYKMLRFFGFPHSLLFVLSPRSLSLPKYIENILIITEANPRMFSCPAIFLNFPRKNLRGIIAHHGIYMSLLFFSFYSL